MSIVRRQDYFAFGLASLLLLVAGSLLLVNFESLIALAIGSLLYVALHVILLSSRERLGTGITIYLAYVTLALLLYAAQLLTNPEYQGFSGGLGIGTDDSHYYSLTVDEVPVDFPVRPGYGFRTSEFTEFLRVFAGIIEKLAGAVHPLDLILINAVGLALLPCLTYKLAHLASGDRRVARLAQFFTLVCPFLLSNGLILMRDGWMAAMFIACMLCVIQRRYVVFLLAAAFSIYLRLEHVALLSVSAWIMAVMLSGPRNLFGRSGWQLTSRGAFLLALPVLLLACIVLLADVGEIIRSVFEFRLKRSGGLIALLEGAAQTGGTSAYQAIDSLPFFIRVPVATLFYFGSPFLAVDELTAGGVIIPRAAMSGLFAILFVGYVGLFVKGVLRGFSDGQVVILALLTVFLVNCVVLSQFSLQLRHKTILMPVFYVVCAYGLYDRGKIGIQLGAIASLMTAMVNILVNSLSL